MLKSSESKNGKDEIGNTANSLYFCDCLTSKYKIKYNSENLKIFSIIFYYKRNECLTAMKITFKNKKDGPALTSNPIILGPNNFSLGNVDEIELTLDEGEEIYSISGIHENGKILDLNINTIFGQYMKFNLNADNNFSFVDAKKKFEWEYYYNNKHLDGFVVGWNEKQINYLNSISKEIDIPEKEKKPEESVTSLTDITNVIIDKEPFYISEMFGEIDTGVKIEDDIAKNNFYDDIRKNILHLSEINVYTEGKKITRIDMEYTNMEKEKKYECKHISTEFKDTNKHLCLILSRENFIYQFGVNLSKNNHLKTIFFKSLIGKELTAGANEDLETILQEKYSNEKAYRLLGIAVGKSNYIQSIQFYYERKNIKK